MTWGSQIRLTNVNSHKKPLWCGEKQPSFLFYSSSSSKRQKPGIITSLTFDHCVTSAQRGSSRAGVDALSKMFFGDDGLHLSILSWFLIIPSESLHDGLFKVIGHGSATKRITQYARSMVLLKWFAFYKKQIILLLLLLLLPSFFYPFFFLLLHYLHVSKEWFKHLLLLLVSDFFTMCWLWRICHWLLRGNKSPETVFCL